MKVFIAGRATESGSFSPIPTGLTCGAYGDNCELTILISKVPSIWRPLKQRVRSMSLGNIAWVEADGVRLLIRSRIRRRDV